MGEFESSRFRQMGYSDINPLDRKFWPDNPDPGFSPQRNEQIVERTINKYEKMRAAKFATFSEGIKERANAVASYLHWVVSNHKSTSMERYFGRRYLAQLRGEEIRDELRGRLTLVGNPEPIKIVDSQGKLKGQNVQQKKKRKVAQRH